MATIKIKRGDTAPALRYAFPAEVDLTDATVAFIMSPRPGGQSVVVAPAAVLTTDPPVAEYTWSQGDTDADGSYYAEFEVSFADGRVQRFPSSGYLRIDIGQWLDSSVPIGGDGPIPPQRQWLTVADLGGAVAEQVTGQVDALVAEQVLPRVADIAATAAEPAAAGAVAAVQSQLDARVTAAQTAAGDASTSRVGAETARAGAESASADFANTAARQPWSFHAGLRNWTTTRTGLPTGTVSLSGLTQVTDDPVFGTSADWRPTAAGNNVLTRGVSPWGRAAYRVTAKLRVISGPLPNVPLSLVAIGLNGNMATPTYYGGADQSVATDGNEVTLSATFAPTADFGADYTAAGLAGVPYARFGVRYGTSGAAQIRIASILVEDATLELSLGKASAESVAFASRDAAAAARIPAPAGRISVFHDGELLHYKRLPSGASISYVPLTTQGNVRWVPDGIPSLRHWGAVSGVTMNADGIRFTGTDCRALLTAMMSWAGANGATKVRINAGSFYVEKPPGTTIAVPVASNGTLEIVGEGMFASTLYYADSAIAAGTPKPMFSQQVGSSLDFMRLADFGIVSDWGANGFWGDSSHAAAFGVGNRKVMVERVRFSNICQMCLVLSGVQDVTVTECYFDRSQRDGAHLVNASRLKVTNNYFRQIGDDSIVFSRTADNVLPSQAIITGNVIEDSQGIYGTGYDSLIVSHNIVRRPHIRGIEILRSASWGDNRGRIPRINYVITDNIVTDVFRRIRFGGAGNECAYIAVGDSSDPSYSGGLTLGKIGSLTDGSYVWNSNGTGVNAPAPYFHKEGNLVGNLNIVIANNICMRTLEPTANYTDYGYGPRYVQNVGPYTGDVLEEDFYGTHIAVRGTMRSVRVSGNLSYGATTPFEVWGFMEGAVTDWDGLTYESNRVMHVRGDRAFDVRGQGVVTFRNNDIDGDPFHLHPARGPNGRWGSATDKVAYRIDNGAQVILDGGSYKNLSSIAQVVSGGVAYTPAAVTLHGDFAGIGDNAANGGVRVVPGNVPVIYARVNTDKTSPDFNKVTGITGRTAAAMPTSGHYLAGQTVMAPVPIIRSGYAVTGWLRLTTGNEHAAGTDWSELRTTIA